MTEEDFCITELPDNPINRVTYYITEYIEGKVGRVFRIINPIYGESKWYKSVVSISAFRRRQNHTNYERYYSKAKVMPLRYSIRDAFDHHQFEQFLKASAQRAGRSFEEVIPIEAGSVFDFYKLIGYDYKTKKFVKNE